ncbi:hypothetical protein SDC9_204171 [bioreactor metagenome]|uniref:Uncharacterized protein n=1 Tax=bioreactor metagenome TaxID=1076179 RepID=A0A645IYS3_9ZZZZ
MIARHKIAGEAARQRVDELDRVRIDSVLVVDVTQQQHDGRGCLLQRRQQVALFFAVLRAVQVADDRDANFIVNSRVRNLVIPRDDSRLCAPVEQREHRGNGGEKHAGTPRMPLFRGRCRGNDWFC